MKLINKHLEWSVFLGGLILLAFMPTEVSKSSLCFFEFIGIEFCPGEGLGHSIFYTLNGDFSSAFNAHLAGPFAVSVLILRIIHVWRNLYLQTRNKEEGI